MKISLLAAYTRYSGGEPDDQRWALVEIAVIYSVGSDVKTIRVDWLPETQELTLNDKPLDWGAWAEEYSDNLPYHSTLMNDLLIKFITNITSED